MAYRQETLLWENTGRKLLLPSPLKRKWIHFVLSSLLSHLLFPVWLVLANEMWAKVTHIGFRWKHLVASVWLSSPLPLVMEIMGPWVNVEVPEDGNQFGLLKIPGESPIPTTGFMWVRKKHLFLKPLRFVGCYCSIAYFTLTDTSEQIRSAPGRPNQGSALSFPFSSARTLDNSGCPCSEGTAILSSVCEEGRKGYGDYFGLMSSHGLQYYISINLHLGSFIYF